MAWLLGLSILHRREICMDAKIMDAKIMDVKIVDAKIIGREIKKTRIYCHTPPRTQACPAALRIDA